jgi:hypothetical protein
MGLYAVGALIPYRTERQLAFVDAKDGLHLG